MFGVSVGCCLHEYIWALVSFGRLVLAMGGREETSLDMVLFLDFCAGVISSSDWLLSRLFGDWTLAC